MKKILRACILGLSVLFMMSANVTCQADDWYYEDNPAVKIEKPTPSATLTFYKGETITTTVTFKPTLVSEDLAPTDFYYPVIHLSNIHAEKEYYFNYFDRIGFKPVTHTVKFNTRSLSTGEYYLMADLYDHPYKYNPDEEIDYSYVKPKDSETSFIWFTLKKLPKPKKVTVKPGRRRVTVSYSKAKGATGYEIFRSTKKNSGYKRIAVTTKTKYVDKKARKGKRYYYKVRSVRNKQGKVTSSFILSKRTKKIR